MRIAILASVWMSVMLLAGSSYFGTSYVGRNYYATGTPAPTPTPTPAPAWYPTDVAGLQVFVDYKDSDGNLAPSNFTKDVSQNISQWNDLSGRGVHLTQGTGSLQPDYTASGVLFDGSDDYLSFVDEVIIGAAQDWSLFWVQQATTVDTNFRGIFALEGTTAANFICDINTNAGYADIACANSNAPWSSAPNLTIGTTTALHYFIITWTSGGVGTYYVDGAAVSPTSGSGRAAGLSQGRLGNDSNGTFSGYIRNFGVYNSVISGTDLDNLKTYLSGRAS